MGNSSSAAGPNGEYYDEDPFDGADTLGYRVLGVQPNSPAAKAGLVSFLDFLVGANEQMLLGSGADLEEGEEYDDVDLPAFLQEHLGKEIEFLVYNIKRGEARLVKLTPDDKWGGAGLMGSTIRLDNYAGAEERIIRILTVEPKSPAAVAGLVPEKDFILGTTHATLDTVDSLAALLEAHQDELIEFYVYNTDSDLVRTVVLMPTLSWGGGLLGAEVGTGYLNRLPHHSCSTDGASVERRVRYIQKPEQQSTAATESNGKTTNGNSSNTKTETILTETTGVVEYEPQLEMEPADEEKSESSSSPPSPAAKQGSNKIPPPPKPLDAVATPAKVDGLTVTLPLPPPPKMNFATPHPEGR